MALALSPRRETTTESESWSNVDVRRRRQEIAPGSQGRREMKQVSRKAESFPVKTAFPGDDPALPGKPRNPNRPIPHEEGKALRGRLPLRAGRRLLHHTKEA